MTNSHQIKALKESQSRLRQYTDIAFLNLGKNEDANVFSLDGIANIATRAINNAFKKIDIDIKKIELLEQDFKISPNSTIASKLLEFSKLLLLKKFNKDAIRVLTKLINFKFQDSIIPLGRIFMYGVKSKLGRPEYKNKKNALKCFKLGHSLNIQEASYLLGVLYRENGQKDTAKTVFSKNMREGCIKSTVEVICILQEELSDTNNENEKQRIAQVIFNLRSDLDAN